MPVTCGTWRWSRRTCTGWVWAAPVHESFCIRDVVVGKFGAKWAGVLVPKLLVSKLGPVRFPLSRPVLIGHGMGRVTLDRQGRWHVSFSVPQARVERTATGVVVGLDRGVANRLAMSDGEHLGITRVRLGELTGRHAGCRKDWVEQISMWLVRT